MKHDPDRMTDAILFVADIAIVAGLFLAVAQAIGL